MKRILSAVLLFSLFAIAAHAQAPAQPATETVEYYYKVKWGYQEEFLTLFKKNHYPILKKQIEMGRMVSVKMESPVDHMTEDARWDFRVTIVFRKNNPAFDEPALIKQLYPDQATYKKEEQRRFEILLAHWDLPVGAVDLNAAP